MNVMSSGVEGAMEEESLEPGDMGVETGLQSDIPYLVKDVLFLGDGDGDGWSVLTCASYSGCT